MSNLNPDILSPGNHVLDNCFTNSIVPQLFVDSNMILRRYTSPAAEQFSLSMEDIGMSIHSVKGRIGYKALAEKIRGVLMTETSMAKEVQTKNGSCFKMNIQPYFCNRELEIEGVFITFLDITGHRATMKELERLHAEHETLMFALSHDIKQPLSTIGLLSDSLLETFKNKDEVLFRKWIGILKRTSKSMQLLLDQFIEHPATEKDIIPSKERVNIKKLCLEVIEVLKEQLSNDKIMIHTDFTVAEIEFSRNNLRSIVFNLLENAFKYRKPGEDLVLSLSTRRADQYVLFSVCDNGMGISQKDQKRLFEKSTRLNKNIDGTGMGLYIIRRMMENSNGKIEVRSTLNKGSNFHVYFKM